MIADDDCNNDFLGSVSKKCRNSSLYIKFVFVMFAILKYIKSTYPTSVV